MSKLQYTTRTIVQDGEEHEIPTCPHCGKDLENRYMQMTDLWECKQTNACPGFFLAERDEIAEKNFEQSMRHVDAEW